MFEQLSNEEFRVAEKSRLKTFKIDDKGIKTVRQLKIASNVNQVESCPRYDMLVLLNSDGNLQAI